MNRYGERKDIYQPTSFKASKYVVIFGMAVAMMVLSAARQLEFRDRKENRLSLGGEIIRNHVTTVKLKKP
jgi:hypothetical protein